jgi:radical SAM protein with 4Fe4S-binding SPASM domain
MHCYSSSQSSPDDAELTAAEAKAFLAQLAEVNCCVLLFSGGEPLLRHDLFGLLAEAQRLNLRTVLSTNGTLIDSAVAKRLAELTVAYVGISLDGDEQFHDKFRGSKGSFKAALAGIENCRKAGIRTGLRFTITKANADQVPVIFDIATSGGARRICFYHLIHSGRAKNLADQTLTPQQSRQTVDTIIERTSDSVQKGLVDEVLTVDNHCDGPYLLVRMQKENNTHFENARRFLLANGGNKIGEKLACVGWDGTVHPDQFWRNYSLGCVKENSFEEIWQNSADPVLSKLRNKSNFADPRCLKCQWFNLCKGNYRFLTSDPTEKSWLNEPPCYLTDDEVGLSKTNASRSKVK